MLAARAGRYIVPYVAARYGITPRFRRTAASFTGMAARYATKYAARRIQRSWRGRRKRKRSYRSSPAKRVRLHGIGERVGTTTAKRTTVLNSAGAKIATRALHSLQLTQITHSTSNSIDDRQRNIANIRGFKLCLQIANLLNTANTVNIAVIAPKNDDVSSIGTNDFFRGSAGDRAIDFAVGLTGNQFHCTPINADKYVIMTHKRMILPGIVGQGTITSDYSGHNYRQLNMYVPFKRQVRWDQSADTTPDHGKVFLVYWCDKFMDTAGTTSITDSLETSISAITYWKEPRS
ncbi:MAG: putative capsid protein [Tantalovirus resnatis]|uniref:Putative capsid protein n=1 Tax=Circoviridae sp. TaxID=1954248 RepID=A0A385E3T3_9VIRU|nr:MAG: putative capsid protein [Circoviridae sp.]